MLDVHLAIDTHNFDRSHYPNRASYGNQIDQKHVLLPALLVYVAGMIYVFFCNGPDFQTKEGSAISS
jgi:hypothetical protein